MTLSEIRELDRKYYMNTFGDRTPLCFTGGDGIELTATDGKVYKDFFAGIAVNCLGYGHKRLTSELCDQVTKVIHTSNIYYGESQAKLAQALVENTCADRVFFCNSGAEANEGAIKLAKKYFVMKGQPERIEFITLKNSFHGRTLATVAATGQEKYQKPYKPLLEKFIHVEINDTDALKRAVTDKTAAIMVELIQGESGVHPMTREYVDEIVKICKENDIIFIADEIQTGVGRCGELFAHQYYGVEPDIFTMAKGLGGGVPIGGFAAKQKFADAFVPGDHGTTFGGNPLAMRAGCVVIDEMLNGGVIDNAREVGAYFFEKLNELAETSGKIAEVRGAGLMIGIEFKDEIAKSAGAGMREKGYLVGTIGTKVFRIVPPLIVTKNYIDGFIGALGEVLA
ncbi:MAG: aspartate aminotransferase family protein [Clostridiales bacterium]|nr:aspartate aminotransferase family protein [Clostridiales bacterium]